MPIIEIHLLEGRSVIQKRALIAGITDAVTNALGVKSDQVRILIDELLPEHFAVSGKTRGEHLERVHSETLNATYGMANHEKN
ncbi:2-hydroxymuconate tautomerase [Noviherbaspirillum sedimenti]|uniref:Tautomerase n=1 Tax=Noviherbaspirillum sedimenti TaxID=2320865 RepID=A0A3A3G9E8_9BURK|nr:2-hydroxymuconate tautomerase [Noviherbaspirillum sedimenti]RJG04414.1 4-oxalocrotonate tautomerase [Noviherbaspirillum sedimenti]